MLAFNPAKPKYTAGFKLASLRVHVRDHKQRELPLKHRTLEAHYDGFVFTQTTMGAADARQYFLETSHGPNPTKAEIAGNPARVYERGPEPEPDDIDGRNPAIVTWYDGDIFYFLASDSLGSAELVRVAFSIY